MRTTWPEESEKVLDSFCDLNDTLGFHKSIYDELIDETIDEEEIENQIDFIEGMDDFPTGQLMFIVIDYYDHQSEDSKSEIIIRAWHSPNCEERFVILRGLWTALSLKIGDPFFVVGEWRKHSNDVLENRYTIILENSSGFLVFYPQICISATRLSGYHFCARSSYLRNILPSGVQTSNMLFGTLAHEMIQKIISGADEGQRQEALTNLITEATVPISMAGETETNMVEQLQPIVQLAKTICENVHEADMDIEDSIPPYGCVPVAEEEDMRSFVYGLNGRSDITLKKGSHFFPLEMKSGSTANGRPKEGHKIQLYTYILLMREKYKQKSEPYGALFYMNDNKSLKLTPFEHELQSMMLMRNRLVTEFVHGELPMNLKDPQSCMRCDAIYACGLWAQIEKQSTTFLNENFGRIVPEDSLQLYKEWDTKLVDQLQQHYMEQADIWLIPVEARVRRGTAACDLVLENDEDNNYILRSENAFRFSNFNQYSSFLMTIGGNPPIIGQGSIKRIEKFHIVVRFFELVIDYSLPNLCIDIFDYPTHIAISRSNLTLFFAYSNSLKFEKLFIKKDEKKFPHLRSSIEIVDMHREQRKSVEFALSNPRITLINGAPRSGKTLVLATLINHFYDIGKKVLVVGSNDSSIDRFCLEIMNNVPFMRVTSILGIHPSIVPFSSSVILRKCKESSEVLEVIKNYKVFMTSVDEILHWILVRNHFDYLIVDDSESISIPSLIGPISICDRMILAGDLHQLRPSDKFESMFHYFCNKFPSRVQNLTISHLVPKQVADILSVLFYKFRIRAWNEAEPLEFEMQNIRHFHEFHLSWIRHVTDTGSSISVLDISRGFCAFSSCLAISLVLCNANPAKLAILASTRKEVEIIRNEMKEQIEVGNQYLNGLEAETILSLITISSISDIEEAVCENIKQIEIVIWIANENISDSEACFTISLPINKLIVIGDISKLCKNAIMNYLIQLVGNSNLKPIMEGIFELDMKPFLSLTNQINLEIQYLYQG